MRTVVALQFVVRTTLTLHESTYQDLVLTDCLAGCLGDAAVFPRLDQMDMPGTWYRLLHKR